jgi:serine/threonine protein kinase
LAARKLKHPNIVQFLGVHTTPQNVSYMVTEYMEKGDLLSVLKDERNDFAFSELLKMYNSYDTNDSTLL